MCIPVICRTKKELNLFANDTIKTAMQTGITEGEKLIAAQVPNLGTEVNGWRISPAGHIQESTDTVIVRVKVPSHNC
jgi:hypothetical protein